MFYRRSYVVLAMVIAMGLFCGNAAADTLVLKDGRKFEGRVVSKSAYLVTFEIITAGMKTLKNFAPDEIQEIIPSDPVTAPLATTGPTPAAALVPIPGTTSTPASPNPVGPTYLVVPLRGEFGKEIIKDVVEKCLEKAKETQASAVVFEITSNGGEVQATIELLDLIVAWQANETIPLVALIKGQAYSAAAIFSMGLKHVYMMPGSTMGAAMIISVHSDGSVDALDSTRVGEKFASAYRGKFRTVAEAAGHDPLIMEAMVDPDVVLSIARDLDGKPVILKGTPAENTANGDQYSVAPRLLSERGKLLTLSAGEAVDVGVAGALVNNYDDLAKQMNLVGWADAGDAGRKIVDDHDKDIRDNISKYDKSIKTINEGISRIRRLGGHELAGFEQNVIAIRNAIVRVEKMAEKHNYIAHRLAMDFPQGTEDLKAQCDNALGNIKDYRRQMRAR